ncbi:MAG: hypothetical protein NTY47_05120 [Candidatus Omnitrophica bacterium]|nr:hypothetical protein [Candidatus Omnitrophota bacterium]
MEIISAFWTFPAIILAAMLIAWAAECGQFFISQGLALAVLAWIQTLPDYRQLHRLFKVICRLRLADGLFRRLVFQEDQGGQEQFLNM